MIAIRKTIQHKTCTNITRNKQQTQEEQTKPSGKQTRIQGVIIYCSHTVVMVTGQCATTVGFIN